MATAFGRRPSEIVGGDDDWAAYQLDAACLTLGRWVENRLAERDKKGRPKHDLERLLADKDEKRTPTSAARARGRVARKVRIRPDGTWE